MSKLLVTGGVSPAVVINSLIIRSASLRVEAVAVTMI